ncbi:MULTISPECIES: hypothetical protein [unclassified Carboxylicivirga]|uniref:hypothetical protein n=1 Tax=Carboxylicivirga TaxID=1628153 RepID=UPI003D3491EC
MKARIFFATMVLMLGVSTAVCASTAEKAAFKKCCRQLNKEIRKTLEGPNFEYLKPDCEETVIVKFVVDENNKLIFHKISGQNEKLINYVESTLSNMDIQTINSSLQGKMLRFPIQFRYRSH